MSTCTHSHTISDRETCAICGCAIVVCETCGIDLPSQHGDHTPRLVYPRPLTSPTDTHEAVVSAEIWGAICASHIRASLVSANVTDSDIRASLARGAAIYAATCARLSGLIEPYQE